MNEVETSGEIDTVARTVICCWNGERLEVEYDKLVVNHIDHMVTEDDRVAMIIDGRKGNATYSLLIDMPMPDADIGRRDLYRSYVQPGVTVTLTIGLPADMIDTTYMPLSMQYETRAMMVVELNRANSSP